MEMKGKAGVSVENVVAGWEEASKELREGPASLRRQMNVHFSVYSG